MIRALAVILWFVAVPAWSDTARVISGEHADFTRLVVELPAAGGWTVGRTPMGYAFATESASQPGYDLSRVWDRIPRTRLQALRADPESGILQLTLACPCHVFPFEYRPGMVVLDIKDGAAPAGSSFETAFTGLPDDLGLPSAAFASPVAYDWLARTRSADTEPAADLMPLPLGAGSILLDPLRAELLEQISRGAAQGVVNMALPGPAPKVAAHDIEVLPWSQIRIGEMPGVGIAGKPAEGLASDGGTCFEEAALNLPAWGADQATSGLLVEARSGLFGEFDRVETEAVLQSIRLHLYLGFGAEAAQIAALLDNEAAPTVLPAYRSMARLIDGEGDPSTPFSAMLGCDGAAALWAALANDRLPPGPQVNISAIVRSFLALPPHLRGNLGPGLTEKLLQRGDTDAARILRDAIRRSPDSSVGQVALLDSKSGLQADNSVAARSHARTAVDTGTSTAESLVALVEAHFRDLEPLSPDVAVALGAFRRETEGTEAAGAIRRALILAYALSGQITEAFAEAEADAGDLVLSDLWQVAQARAGDDDFLRQAVRAPNQPRPQVRSTVALSVAARLLDLGFADAALAWLGTVSTSDPDAQRRVAARAELLRGDARKALTLIESMSEPQDEALRAKALVQLGRLDPARQAYAAAGLPDEAARLIPWEADWDRLRAEGSETWATAAAATEPLAADDAGLLARSAAMVEESAAARAALDALLSSVPPPSP